MLVDELRATFLANGLSDDQLQALISAGEVVTLAKGDEPFHEGAPADYLWILLDGNLELYRQSGNERIVLTTMATPGQWAGGLRAWGEATNSAGYRATGRAMTPGRLFRVPSDELGRLVGEWFPFGKHIITGLFQTVRNIEATARQRESLVALGTLAAGLAHEINNPAAASLRAAEALRVECSTMLTALTDLARKDIGADQFIKLDQLRRDVAAIAPPAADAIAMMDREESFGVWLEQHGVVDPWNLAPTLAASAVDEGWLDDVDATVGRAALTPALRWVVSTMSASSLMSDLSDTTKRISNLVEAVKSYSQMDRASLQRIDLREGIESTLVMLAMKLDNVVVERRYAPDVPEIEAFAAELNQVWANLIDNAIDAMSGAGTLVVGIRLDGKHVVVEITDSGHGMPAEVQERVFEPFFTTKDVGKGTGLGLDISRRIIVDRHGGEISFDSKPGATTASVRLPVSR